MTESISVKTLIENQKSIILRHQKVLLNEDLNIHSQEYLQKIAETLLTHCEVIEALEAFDEPSVSSDTVIDGGDF